MKHKLYLLAIAAGILLLATSCKAMRTWTPVGDYRQQQGDKYTYSKSHQFYILWGYFPLGRTHTATPPNGSCEVDTYVSFGDRLISAITLGIVTGQTVRVKAKRPAPTASPSTGWQAPAAPAAPAPMPQQTE